MRRVGILLSASAYCLILTFASSAVAQYTYVGPSGGDFFSVLNWEDGGALNPASIVDGGTGRIELSLNINGSSVVAGSAVQFGAGSLSLSAGAMLSSTTGNMSFNSGSSLSLDASTLTVSPDASQLQLNNGSTVSLLNSSLTVGDDIFFRGSTSIVDSSVTSVADDIEFQSTATLVTIDGSDFETLNIVEIVSFATPGTITDSTFTTGRLSLQTAANITAIDSVFDLNGDIDDAFNTVTLATLTLEGNTTLEADQLDEGITVVLRDSASMRLIDDDQEGEWITGSSIPGVVSSIVFESANASLTFGGPQDPTDDATQIFHALSGPLIPYSSVPTWFNPSNWNGQDDVTITIALVPEPSGLALASLVVGAVLTRRNIRGFRV